MFRRGKKSESAPEEPFMNGLLLDCRVEPEVDEDRFNVKVSRSFRVQMTRQSVTYWTPALVGASVASVALLALLQLLGSSSNMKPIRLLNGDAASAQPIAQPGESSSLPYRLPVVR